MIGVAIIIVVLIVAIPVGVLMSGGVIAAVIGAFLKGDADTTHEDSELLGLNS